MVIAKTPVQTPVHVHVFQRRRRSDPPGRRRIRPQIPWRPAVAGYTITITPNDDVGAQTTIQVDTGSGSARITELTVRAADGGGMSAHQLSAVNLDALIAALSPTAPASPSVITAAAPTVQPHVVAEADAGVSEPASAPASGRARKSARKSAAKKAPSRTRQAKAEKAATGATATGRRAYRRMPEASEVLDAYRQVGGTTALARHFGVPRHTATGWLRRLRSMGQLDS
jgi:hypothetical protein